jgi:hypothetical protein
VQGVAFDNRGDDAAILGVQVLDEWLTSNDPYGMSTQAGTQWALGAEVGYEQHELIGNPSANPATDSGVNSVGANVDLLRTGGPLRPGSYPDLTWREQTFGHVIEE